MSLDVLQATPMSTIFRGKWWGGLRGVPWIAALPGLVICAKELMVDRWMTVPLVVGVILAHGTALTSQGL